MLASGKSRGGQGRVRADGQAIQGSGRCRGGDVLGLRRLGRRNSEDWTAFGIRKAGLIFAVPPGFSLITSSKGEPEAATFLGPQDASADHSPAARFG